MIRKISIFFVILGFGLVSCDQIEGPFIEDNDNGTEIVENPTKVVIMDFTGHTCKSCPKAHRSIHMIQAVYKEQAIPIAFHLGYFAQPKADGRYDADFRTPEGAVLEDFYDFLSFPIGWVNKMGKDDLIPYPSWAAQTAEYVQKRSPVLMNIETKYAETSHEAQIDIAFKCNGFSDSIVKMAVYLTENHIISYQKDEDATPMDVADYEHNHVFRRAFGDVWGEEIDFTHLVDDGLNFVRTIQMEDQWIAQNIDVVVFIYDPQTMEIIQAESSPLISQN